VSYVDSTDLERKRQEQLPYERAASELQNVLSTFGIDAHVAAHQYGVRVNFYQSAQVEEVAAALLKAFDYDIQESAK